MSTARLLDVFAVGTALAEWGAVVEEREGEVTPEMESDLARILAEAPNAVDQAAGLVKAMEARAELVKREIARLKAIADADEAMADRVRAAMKSAMEASGERTVKGRFTTTLQPNPGRVVIVNVTEVPPEFLVPQPDKVDVAGISKAFKAGGAVPGAEFVKGDASIRIR